MRGSEALAPRKVVRSLDMLSLNKNLSFPPLGRVPRAFQERRSPDEAAQLLIRLAPRNVDFILVQC